MTTTPTQKTALITGASSGIGQAIAKTLLNQDYRVIGIGRDFSKTSLDSPLFEALPHDLSDINATEKLFKALCREQRIDAFIHSAGYGLFGSIEQFSSRQIKNYIETHVTSLLTLLHYLIPSMRKNGDGRIVLIGSESALQAGKKGILYSSAKFAIRGIAQALREDCGKDGIAISLINPGMVDTPFFEDLNFRPGRDSSNSIRTRDIAELVQHILSGHPDTIIDEINLSPRNRSIDFK